MRPVAPLMLAVAGCCVVSCAPSGGRQGKDDDVRAAQAAEIEKLRRQVRQLEALVKQCRASSATRPAGPSTSAATTEAPEPLETLALDLGKGAAMTIVRIPMGLFVMGSPAAEPGRGKDEGPRRRVVVRSFHMGIHEVTRAQYEVLMGPAGGPTGDPLEPVTQVSWHEAMLFCARLSARTGHRARLPTEAEWEYACRAGAVGSYCFGDDAGELGDYAWHSANSGGRPQPVGRKSPNRWGLYDMHGNVWEWCGDWYHPKSYADAAEVDPRGPSSGEGRVLRGGAALYDPPSCRCATRMFSPPDTRGALRGFRVVVEVRRSLR